MSTYEELLAQLREKNLLKESRKSEVPSKGESKKSGAQKGRTRGNGTSLANFKPALTVIVKASRPDEVPGVVVDDRQERWGYKFVDNRRVVR